MPKPPRIHPTAIVEDGVEIADGTSVWDGVHVRGPGTSIGQDCIIGEKTYVAYGVRIGHRCKLNAFVYVCTGVSLGDGVMLSAGVTFTNDRFPRATTSDLLQLRGSEPDEETVKTQVGDGATIGARSTIGPGLAIGRFAMVGMGSIVTRDVGDFGFVVGNPARLVGFVCRCGKPVARFQDQTDIPLGKTACSCGLAYRIESATQITELSPSSDA